MIGVLFVEVKPKCRSQSKKSKYFFESIGSNCIQTYLYMLNRYGIGKETNEHLATHYKNALKALFMHYIALYTTSLVKFYLILVFP